MDAPEAGGGGGGHNLPMLHSAMEQISAAPPSALRNGMLEVRYMWEDGMGDGPLREFLDTMKAIFSPSLRPRASLGKGEAGGGAGGGAAGASGVADGGGDGIAAAAESALAAVAAEGGLAGLGASDPSQGKASKVMKAREAAVEKLDR